MTNPLIPFFRLEINRFVWWKFSNGNETFPRRIDVRMFVGSWPHISERKILALDHGRLAVDEFEVFFGRHNQEGLPWLVSGAVVFFTTKAALEEAGYEFNPNTWKPFVEKITTSPTSKAMAIKSIQKGEGY